MVIGSMVISIVFTEAPKIPNFTEAGKVTLGGRGRSSGSMRETGIYIPESSAFTAISDLDIISPESGKLTRDEESEEFERDNSYY